MANSIQWSERERRDLLAAWKASGLSRTAFAADAAVPRSTFSAWTRRVWPRARAHRRGALGACPVCPCERFT